MKDKHIKTLEKEIRKLRKERKAQASDSVNKLKIQQSMRITLGNDRSVSPKLAGSAQTINEADRIRLEGKISLLTMRNDILAKQVEKYKNSKIC